jgi:hypothetical protein
MRFRLRLVYHGPSSMEVCTFGSARVQYSEVQYSTILHSQYYITTTDLTTAQYRTVRTVHP